VCFRPRGEDQNVRKKNAWKDNKSNRVRGLPSAEGEQKRIGFSWVGLGREKPTNTPLGTARTARPQALRKGKIVLARLKVVRTSEKKNGGGVGKIGSTFILITIGGFSASLGKGEI